MRLQNTDLTLQKIDGVLLSCAASWNGAPAAFTDGCFHIYVCCHIKNNYVIYAINY